jgi:hypothetical protein
VLITKKITEPTGSDLVFKKCPFSFGQENYKPNCRLCRGLGAGCQKKTEKPICSDFVFSFVSSADYQYNFKTNLYSCSVLSAAFQENCRTNL